MFELNPSLRGFVQEDLREQRKEVEAMLGPRRQSAPMGRGLAPQVKQLGMRHVGYGVKSGRLTHRGSAWIDTPKGSRR